MARPLPMGEPDRDPYTKGSPVSGVGLHPEAAGSHTRFPLPRLAHSVSAQLPLPRGEPPTLGKKHKCDEPGALPVMRVSSVSRRAIPGSAPSSSQLF